MYYALLFSESLQIGVQQDYCTEQTLITTDVMLIKFDRIKGRPGVEVGCKLACRYGAAEP